MSWDLTTAKARLGITDDAQDAQITTALAVSLGLAEKYCDRRFPQKAETARFFADSWPTLLVRRYPILSVQEVRTPDGNVVDPANYGVEYELGMVRLGGYGRASWPAGTSWARGAVEVDFTGGFDPLPEDLEAALWLVFDNVWATTPGMGLPAGSTTNAGVVRSFSIDGMSLGYETSNTGGTGGGGAAPDEWGLIPATATALLRWYRAETVTGGA